MYDGPILHFVYLAGEEQAGFCFTLYCVSHCLFTSPAGFDLALLFWLFGGFRCGVCLCFDIRIRYKN